MQTDTIMAFQIEDGDTIQVGDFTYTVTGDSVDTDDGLLFDTRDEDDETTQLWFAPFDTVALVVKFDDDEPWEDVLIED